MFNVIFILTLKNQAIVLLNLQFNSKESGICYAYQNKLVGER